MKQDKITWLAKRIYTSFPGDFGPIMFYSLDCGCTYLKRIFPDGKMDPIFGIYRDGESGRCDKCMIFDDTWKDRVTDEVAIYYPKIHIVVDEP